MNGKWGASLIVVAALVAGMAIYYLQVYGYYYEVTPQPGEDVTLVSRATGQPEPIPYSGFRAIDADSSPIRYRSCFTTPLTTDQLAAYVPLDSAEPLVAPGWFDCFDAEEIGRGVEAGQFHMYLSVKNIAYGVDRVVAIAPDGRGWAWNELNHCGRKAYDGTPVGEDCPPRTEGAGS
ncbi:DUF6446 family protein [Pseudodonghicola xiamenensis]|uniref:Signal transduction histidine kinase n=1 Tax=Pseudodonghicola xiamenensis TaxID=337702 RepID=A0A8J3HA92_9RHOB|nr:DUF6446 family protein [Pseudodonghicola xiamenensis]GHG95772.1 signal transduction histidine kinase [Pseudodonghicola xiamenensis]